METNAPNLIDNYDEDSTLGQKLEYDVRYDTTELPVELEEQLNEVGIFDNEIEQFSEDTINKIKDSVSTQVSVMYYSVNDKTGDEVEMSMEEIDDLIDEKIENGEMEFEEESNIIDACLTKIGILPTEVKASSNTASDTKVSTSGAVKQYLICSQTSKGGKIYVTYSATWMEEAYYRNKDVCGVTISNAVINQNSWQCDHHATYSYTNCSTGKVSKTKLHTEPNTYHIESSGSGVTYTVNLFGSRKKMQAVAASGAGIEHYIGEYISIRFECKVETKSKKYVTFTSDYWHLKTNASITPSISFSSSGLSVGISGSSKNYYSQINRNAYVQFKHM